MRLPLDVGARVIEALLPAERALFRAACRAIRAWPTRPRTEADPTTHSPPGPVALVYWGRLPPQLDDEAPGWWGGSCQTVWVCDRFVRYTFSKNATQSRALETILRRRFPGCRFVIAHAYAIERLCKAVNLAPQLVVDKQPSSRTAALAAIAGHEVVDGPDSDFEVAPWGKRITKMHRAGALPLPPIGENDWPLLDLQHYQPPTDPGLVVPAKGIDITLTCEDARDRLVLFGDTPLACRHLVVRSTDTGPMQEIARGWADEVRAERWPHLRSIGARFAGMLAVKLHHVRLVAALVRCAAARLQSVDLTVFDAQQAIVMAQALRAVPRPFELFFHGPADILLSVVLPDIGRGVLVEANLVCETYSRVLNELVAAYAQRRHLAAALRVIHLRKVARQQERLAEDAVHAAFGAFPGLRCVDTCWRMFCRGDAPSARSRKRPRSQESDE